MQDTGERAEVGELQPRPGHLLKVATRLVRGTGHHKMPFAVEITHLDECLPACTVRVLLPDCFQTLQPFPYR